MSYHDDQIQSKVDLEVHMLHGRGYSYDDIVEIVHGAHGHSIIQVVRAYERAILRENALRKLSQGEIKELKSKRKKKT